MRFVLRRACGILQPAYTPPIIQLLDNIDFPDLRIALCVYINRIGAYPVEIRRVIVDGEGFHIDGFCLPAFINKLLNVLGSGILPIAKSGEPFAREPRACRLLRYWLA